ncbi:unnamed protein product [Arctogadus glacialis]
MGLRRLRWLYREGEADPIITTSRLDILLYLALCGLTPQTTTRVFGSVLFDSAAAQTTTLVVQGRRSRSHIHHHLKTWMSYSTFLGLLHGSNWRCSSTQLDDHHSLVLHSH